ncbi:MAG: T9SS C-terminal target domain-containing protein [Calditrichaeota bacterium]|nr:MAG: T9SS C-terminal target domain-containing protein [Calditrichota bacterium]
MSGRRIFWEDNRNGNWDIYMLYYFYYYGSLKHLEWPITPIMERNMAVKPDQCDPHIWGDNLVFADDRNGNWDIYLYKFHNAIWGNLALISGAADDEFGPRACGDRIVWYDDEDPNPSIISESDVFMWERPAGADLSISGSDDKDPVILGDYITYTINVMNQGPWDASGVIVYDTLSSSVNFISAECSRGSISQLGNSVTWTIGDLPDDSTAVIRIMVQTTTDGIVRNSANISGNEIDRVADNNAASVRTTVKLFADFFIHAGAKPRVATDLFSNAHLCFISDRYGGNLYYATNTPGYWKVETLISSGDILNPAIVVDHSGDVHICYAQGDGWSNSLKYINNAGGSWSSPETIDANAEECKWTNIDVDNSNFIHMSYTTSQWSGADLRYVNNTSGSWVSTTVYDNVYNSASMDIDKNGYAHFVLYSWAIGGPAYITNAPAGNWQIPELIESGWIGGQMESLVIDVAISRTSIPHVSYVGQVNGNGVEDYKYATKVGGNWQLQKIDDGKFAGGHHAITVNPFNNVHMSYHYTLQNQIRYSTNESGTFQNHLIDESAWDWWFESNDITSDSLNRTHICYVKNENVYYATNASYSSHYGGGDAGTGGYYFANSTPAAGGSASQPTYEWIDPVASGHTEILSWSAGNGDDGYFGPQDIGFHFNFYDSLYSQVYINTNGYLSFKDGYDLTAEDSFIPHFDEPNNMLAACAMNLDAENSTHPDAHIYYGGDNSHFVVTYWHTYDHGSSTDYITFQIILYSNGNIKYQYNNLESTDPFPDTIHNDALVGIENYFGSQGISYRNNGAGGPLFGSPLALMFGKNNLYLPIEAGRSDIPREYILFQNYPNPFNPSTTIRYSLPRVQDVEITIFNILGQQVRFFNLDNQPAGTYHIVWDGRNDQNIPVASGMYIYQIKAGDFRKAKKMVLIR